MDSEQSQITLLFEKIEETGILPEEINQYGEDVVRKGKNIKRITQLMTGKGLDGMKHLQWIFASAFHSTYKIPIWCPECESRKFPVNYYVDPAHDDDGVYCDECAPEGHMKYTDYSHEGVKEQYGDHFEIMVKGLRRSLETS